MKYKGYKVFKKPNWLKFWKFRGAELFNTIYLREDLYSRFVSNDKDAEVLSVLAHEVEHIQRAKKVGMLKTNLLYWLSRDFRYQHELASIKKEMKELKAKGLQFNISKRAMYLSGRNYL